MEAGNEDQKTLLYRKMLSHFGGAMRGRKVAGWGLSFKPQTDDMREAPSLAIIGRLLEAGADVQAYDPVAMPEARNFFGERIGYAEDRYGALEGADCLALETEWPEFRFPDLNLVKQLLKEPVVFDGRNIYDAGEMRRAGFDYYCIGINTRTGTGT